MQDVRFKQHVHMPFEADPADILVRTPVDEFEGFQDSLLLPRNTFQSKKVRITNQIERFRGFADLTFKT